MNETSSHQCERFSAVEMKFMCFLCSVGRSWMRCGMRKSFPHHSTVHGKMSKRHAFVGKKKKNTRIRQALEKGENFSAHQKQKSIRCYHFTFLFSRRLGSENFLACNWKSPETFRQFVFLFLVVRLFRRLVCAVPDCVSSIL